MQWCSWVILGAAGIGPQGGMQEVNRLCRVGSRWGWERPPAGPGSGRAGAAVGAVEGIRRNHTQHLTSMLQACAKALLRLARAADRCSHRSESEIPLGAWTFSI